METQKYKKYKNIFTYSLIPIAFILGIVRDLVIDSLNNIGWFTGVIFGIIASILIALIGTIAEKIRKKEDIVGLYFYLVPGLFIIMLITVGVFVE